MLFVLIRDMIGSVSDLAALLVRNLLQQVDQFWEVIGDGSVNILHAQGLILMGSDITKTGDIFPGDIAILSAKFVIEVLHKFADVYYRHANGTLKHFIIAEGIEITMRKK